MKISSAQQNLSSSHAEMAHREVSERLRTWVGGEQSPNRREARANNTDNNTRNSSSNRPQDSTPTRLSSMAQALARAAAATPPEPPRAPPIEAPEASAIAAAMKNADNDPMLSMLRSMLEHMFGIKPKTFDPSELNADISASQDLSNGDFLRSQKVSSNATSTSTSRGEWGMEYEYHEQRTEIEMTRFAAEGVVKTEDGLEISFKLSLEMTRSYTETTDIFIQAGNAPKVKDPLIMNFAGPAAQLADQFFQIDLNDDGQLEKARFAAQGSGFLVFDKNADGKINSGKEMFGPSTGDGFAELAAHDSDDNGWIDENDAIYTQLRIWTKAIDGKDILRSLKDSSVGAISLARLATPFAINDSENTLLGQVRSSGVYLTDDGRAGSVQQVDLAV